MEYATQNGLLYPILAAAEPEYEAPLHKWGTIYKAYLQEVHPARYAQMIADLSLMKQCHLVEQEAETYLLDMEDKLKKQYQPPENQQDFQAMAQYHYRIASIAEELTLNDIIHRN